MPSTEYARQAAIMNSYDFVRFLGYTIVINTINPSYSVQTPGTGTVSTYDFEFMHQKGMRHHVVRGDLNERGVTDDFWMQDKVKSAPIGHAIIHKIHMPKQYRQAWSKPGWYFSAGTAAANDAMPAAAPNWTIADLSNRGYLNNGMDAAQVNRFINQQLPQTYDVAVTGLPRVIPSGATGTNYATAINITYTQKVYLHFECKEKKT